MQRKQLISEAKQRVRGITDEISALIDERACLRIVIAQDKYISDTWRSRLKHRMAVKRYDAKKKTKRDMLEAALGGVRAD